MSQWPSQKLHLNPYVSDSGFAKINDLDLDCKVSSRIPLNISTTNETLEELSFISPSYTSYFIQVTIF